MSATSAAERYLDRKGKGTRREVVTPEGVPLGFTLAQSGDRVAAFLIDTVFIFATIAVLVALLVYAGGAAGTSWLLPFVMLAVFLLQNFYFMFFELRWQGATPGKRMIGIRVIDRHGGPLSAQAIVARNLVRDVEVWLPLQVILAPTLILSGAPGWARFLSVAWLFVLALLPMLNKDRARVGDLIAGTLVVLAPKTLLLPDITGEGRGTTAADAAYTFTDEQLDVYGIYELQVLEDLLRKESVTFEDMKALDAVCDQIKRKIQWDDIGQPIRSSEPFLRDFYRAMRAHLERKMLFGKRREDKYSRE